MAEMLYNDKLPHNYTNHDKKGQNISRAKEEILALNENVTKLKNTLNLSIDSLEQLKGITPESVQSYIMGECEKLLQSAKFVPNELLVNTRNKFFYAFKDAEPIVNEICEFLTKYDSVALNWDENGTLTFDEESLDAFATEKATVHLTKEFRDKYDAYKALYNAFVECNRIEKENGWKELSVEGKLAPFGEEILPLSIWQILTGSYLGAKAQELTPDRFINEVARFL